jgi:hypothetical protein
LTSGKTVSALRLACGIQRVTPGEIFIVDTEGRRALHYAPSAEPSHCETYAAGNLTYFPEFNAWAIVYEFGALPMIHDPAKHPDWKHGSAVTLLLCPGSEERTK